MTMKYGEAYARAVLPPAPLGMVRLMQCSSFTAADRRRPFRLAIPAYFRAPTQPVVDVCRTATLDDE